MKAPSIMGVREYAMLFLYRTAVCLCLFLLCVIADRLWHDGFCAFRERLFYSVNYGLLAKELKDIACCLVPK